MPLDRNKLKQLYSTLQKGGYSQSYDQFENGFTGNNNYANRKKVYDLLTANGAQIGNSYEDFMKRIYTPGATPQRQAPPQQRRAAAPAKSNNGGSGFQFDPNFGKQSQETFFNGGRQTHVGGKYDPIEAGRRQYRASQANNPTVKRQAAQGNPHAKKAVEQGVKAQKEIEGEEAQSRQRRTGQTPQQQARVDASLQIDPEKASKRIQQKMDEAAYMAETGKELKNPVEIGTKIGENGEVIGDPLIAPTLAREENGNIQRGANGEPLIGASSDAERTNAYKQTLVERQKPTIDERINEAEEERERLEEQLKKRGAELDAQNEGSVWRDLPRGGGAGVHTINSTDVNGRNTDTEYLDLLAAQKKVDEQLRDLKAARDEKTGTFLGGAWRGFRDYAFDLSNWDGGYRDLLTSSAMLRSKYGVPKTKREKAAERSMMENTYKADNAAQEAEDALGNGYRFMRIGAQSLPFALNFMAGNLTGITSGIARAGEALGVKAARNIAIKQGANNILRNLGRSVLRNTGVMLGDLGASTALTTTMQAGQTASDIFNRHVGNVTYDPKTDDYNLENGKSLGRSIYEGVANSTIENYTEMLGEHMHFGKFAKWGLNKIGLGKVSDWFTKVCKTDFMQGVNKYLEMGGFNGYPQEVAEEEVGIPLHAIFDGGNQFSDLKDKRQQLDIVGGMLFSMAGMGAGSLALNAGGKVAHKAGMAIQYQQDQHNLNNADKVASFRLTDEKWQPLKEKIDDTTNDDFGKVMSGILSDKSLAPQEKSAVWDYAQRMLIMRGHNMGQVAATKNGMTDQATNASNESFEAGYNAGSEDLNRIKAAYDNARSQAEQTFSPEDLKKIDDDPVSYLRDLGDGEGSQYTRQAVMEYSNAKTAYDGMIQRAKDDLDSKLQDVNMTIDSHVQSADNGGDGMIHPITMKAQNDNGTDKKAYIISGNVVMTDDGTMVDDKKSSPSIIIRNEDGSIEMTSADRILSVDEPLDPETERKQAVESVQQQFAQERANEIDGTLGFAEGDNYQVIGSDNAEHSVNVIQDNGDGTVTAVWDGHTDQPVQLSKDDVQQMSDAYRLQQYSQEQEEANQEEKEAESQEQQPDEQEAEDELPAGTPRETISYEPDMEMKPEVGNSVYVTDKDGNMVHGEVTQTDDLEGKYLVRTDKKVNGKLVQPFNQEEILYEVHRMKPQEEESPQIIDSGENGGENGGVSGGENTDEEQKPQRAIDLIPSQEVDDGKGNVRTVHQWEQAEPGNTYDALTEIYHGNADRVKKGIDNRVGKIDKAIKGVQKKMDAIDNSDDFDEVAAQAEQYDQLQQQKQALQDEKKYWQKVQAVPVTRRGIDIERQKAAAKARAEEERKKAEEAFEQRRSEEEAQRQAAEAEAQKAAAEKVNYGSSAEDAVPSSPAEKRHAELEKAKSSSELRTIAKRIYGDDIIGDEEPRTVEELVASNLVPHSLNFEGKTVNGVQQRGVSQELGMERRGIGNGSDTNPINYWLAPTGQGFSVNQAAHEIWESRPPQMQSVDTEEIKNALLDLLQTATKPRDISDLILRNRIDEAEQMLAADEEREQAAKEQEAWQHDQEVKTITDMLLATVADWNVTPKMEDIINSEVIDETYEDAMIALHRDDDLIEALELINNDNGQNENAEGTGLGEESQRRATERGTAQGEGTVQGEESNQTRDGGSRAEQQGQSAGTEGRTGTAVRSNSSGAQAERSTGASQAEPSRVGEEERRNGIRLTREEAESFIDSMEQKADFPIELELTPTNWDKEFGTNGVVTTPLGAVKMGEHQYLKLARRGRNSKLGMIKPTLQHPDIIIEDHSEAKEGDTSERNSSYVFIKTFLKPDGTRYYYFTSITVSKDGMEVVVSNQEKSRNRILRLMTEGNVVWYTPKDVTTSSAEKQGLDYDQSYKAETESKGSGITPQHIPSSAKIAQLSRKDKEKAEKVSPEGEKSSIGATSAPEKVETERQGVNTEPSEKQKEAGNYKKGHIKVDGYDITIENPKGSVRVGKDENGKALWRTPMHYDYGYILGTKGTDGDHIDVYLSDTPTEGNVYVVDQIDQKTGDFDEHKVMYGFPSKEAAIDAYKSQYEKGWKVGTVTEVSREDFKKWVESSKRKTKPFSEYKSVKEAAAKQPTEKSGQPRLVSRGTEHEALPTLKEPAVYKNNLAGGDAYVNIEGNPKSGYVVRYYDNLNDAKVKSPIAIGVENMTAEQLADHLQKGDFAPTEKSQEFADMLGTSPDKLREILNDTNKYNNYNTYGRLDEFKKGIDKEKGFALVDKIYGKQNKKYMYPILLGKMIREFLDSKGQTLPTEKESGNSNPEHDKKASTERTEQKQNKGKTEKPKKANAGQFGLVSDERMEELKKRLRAKLNNLNMGVDPEVLAIGLELTAGYIDRGVKKFADYSKAMINDLGDVVRPYLKAFYNGVRDMPEITSNGLDAEMDDYETVSKFNVATIGKEGEETHPSILDTAEQVSNEQTVQRAASKVPDEDVQSEQQKLKEEKQEEPVEEKPLVQAAKETGHLVIGGVPKTGEKRGTRYGVHGYTLRPATEEDVENNRPVYVDGKREFIVMLVRSGEQVSATQMSAPRVEAVYLTNNQRVPLDKLEVEDIPTTVHLKSAGDFIEAYGNDAVALGECTGVTVTDRHGQKMAGFPKRMLDEYAGYIVNAGWHAVTLDGKTIAEAKKKETPTEKKSTVKGNNSSRETKKSQKKAVSSQPKEQSPYVGDLFANDNDTNQNTNDNGLQRTDESRTGGLQTDRNNEGEHSSGQSKGTEEKREGSDRSGAEAGVRGVQRSNEQPVRPSERLNTHNNHTERGKDYAPKGVDDRIEANIAAIELSKKIADEGRTATPSEMKVLRRFSGWGGLGKAFTEPDWQTRNPYYKRLKDLLTDDEWQEAEMSRNSAYFTPSGIIGNLWDIARALGFKGGNVLEGSAGIGNILGLMPTAMSEKSHIQAVEIDGTTGTMLSQLYPDAKVDIQGFETTNIRNGSVDLAITNVPFVTGLHVNDTTGDKDLSRKFGDIHDFCIAKNVRKLKPGGLGIFITSNGTMDKSQKLRDWLVSDGDADVIGAFRLNNETFGGTSVTSDIIVIRKRVNGVKSPMAIDVSKVGVERIGKFQPSRYDDKEEERPIDYNQYFIDHPENMGGKIYLAGEKGDTFRPASKGLYPVSNISQKKRLENWVQKLGEAATAARQQNNEQEPQEDSSSEESKVYESLGKDVKEGSMLVNKDGDLCIATYGQAIPLAVNKNKVKGHTKVECFNDYKKIKDAVQAVLDYQTENSDDKGLKPLLDNLNKAYDNFVKTYGHLNKNVAISFLKNDMDFSGIAALESFKEYNDDKGKRQVKYEKSEIFNHRVVEKETEPHPTTVKDGVITSIYKSGHIDLGYIANELGKSEEDVKKAILDEGLGFEDPVSGETVVSYEYLSGNVREKLRQAQNQNEDGRYNTNIKELQKVIPMNIPAHLIEYSLGSSWLDPELYEQYIQEKTGISVKVRNIDGTWAVNAPDFGLSNEKNRMLGVQSDMCGKTIWGHELIIAAMRNKSIVVQKTVKNYDGTTEIISDKEATRQCGEKIDEIRQDFKDWARAKMQQDPELGKKYEDRYNDQFNNYVPKSIPDNFVPKYFSGATHKITLRPHQAKAAIRGTTQNLMLAHEVGSGKTFTLISTAMEMRRLGTAHKPMVVVQNATVGQFVSSAKFLYPNAKILTLEDKDRNLEGRKAFYAKIKYNDWDMIVIPQSVLNMIPDSEDRQLAFIRSKVEEKERVLEQMSKAGIDDPIMTRRAQKELDDLNDEMNNLSMQIAEKRKKKRDEKKAAVARQNAAVKAQQMLDRKVDDVENFDGMGIDALLVDEAHEYKHLGFATAMQRGVKGIDPSYSSKCQSVYLKCQSIMEKTGGKNIIFATGTPISNTAAEIWTFMKYLMPEDTMKDYGIYYFDDFVRNFGDIANIPEFNTSGKFVQNNRFKGYQNLPELVRIWSSVSDTVLSSEISDLKAKIPEMKGGKAQDIYLPQTRALRSVMKFVREQLEAFEKMSGKEKRENSAIPLKMYGIAKAAAVDPRLVMDNAEDDPHSKTNACVRETLKALDESKKYQGTVAIFADNYQNNHSGFNLFEDIKSKLVKGGVPENQVVVIKPGMTVKKKTDIFDKVNAGQVRVVLGTTATLGTGVNMQERLYTLIHLDAPNRPMDYTQRNGRILRQGNLHKEWGIPVKVIRFGVEDSLDVTAYQRLKTKGVIAESIMHGKDLLKNAMENRTIEEEEDQFGDTVAQLSGSEYALLKQQAERELRKYEGKRKQWEADQVYIHAQKPRLEGQIKAAEQRAKDSEEALNTLAKTNVNQPIVAGKKQFANTEAMGDFIKDFNKKVKASEDELRKSYSSDKAVYELTMKIGGLTFNTRMVLSRKTEQRQGSLFDVIKRDLTYSCPELKLENVPVKGSLLRNALEDITQNVLTGNDFRERKESAESETERLTKELDMIKSREGKPFEYGKELEEAEKKVEDYTKKMKVELDEKQKKYAEMDAEVDEANLGNDQPNTPDEAEEGGILYREVDDDEAARLDNEPTVKVYRAMQEHDGKLYPPMSGRVKKQVKTKKGTMRTKWVWRDPIEVGKWEASEEHPEMANEDGTFTLDKGNGSTINAAYNPYIHTSRTPINDQFSSAWSRPELVTVEVEVPASELTSGYHAEKAKDATGEVEWKSGPVGREMAAQGKPRMVILSRWDKPVRIVPVDEVADEYAKRLAGTGITVPFNTVPPALRDALVAKGVTISEPEKGNAGQASRPSYEEWMKGNTRQRDGNGPYTDEELSMINDPFVRMLGESHRSKRQQKEFANRERQNMYDAVKDMAEKLRLDNVEIVTMSLEMTDRSGKVHHPKGFYNKANDKIIIVIPNHRNIEDALQTLLHEGVAHYGLRQLFGSHFDTFLKNVYEAGDMDVRRRIADLAIRKYQGDFSVATEEYLASLAEDTDFEDMNASWWQKIKHMFLAMLHDLGFDNFAGTHMFTLSDNELRYILWRSYENLKEPGRYRSILGEAEDITMQNHLGVGNYAEDKLERDLRQAYNNLDAAEINYQNYEAKKEEDPFRYNPKTAAIYKESVDFWKDKIAELENKHEPLDTEDEFEKERQEREEDAKRIKPRIVNTFRKWLKARHDWEKAVDANADNALELGDELNNMNDMMDTAMDAALDYGIDVSQLLKDNGIKDEDMVEWNDMFAGEPDFYSVVDEMYTNPNFDRSSHLRDRYDIGKTPEWMKKIGILGDNFSLSFKNIKTHQGKDADHDLTREEWHELPNAIQHPFLVTQYKGKNDRFRLYVNMVHNGHYVAVGVDVKRVNQGKNQPILEVNSIKTVFGHHGGITGDEKIIAYDEKITPEQQALLRGLNSHEYPTIQELQSGEDVIGKMSEPSPSDAVSNTSKSQLPNNNGRGMINAEGHKTSSSNAKISNNSDTNVNNSENVTEPAAWGKKDLMSKAEQVSYGIDPDLLFRDTIDDDDNTARETYNAWADAAITKLREAWQDSMINVKNLQDAVLKQRDEKIEDYENAYNAENRSHGVSRAEAEYFDDVIYKPLLKTVNKTAKEAGVSVGDVTEYMMAKHGLERNRVFAERDANAAWKKYQEQQKAKYDEYAKTHPKGKLTQADFIKKSYDDFFNGYRERDYSGLTALTGTDNVQDAEAEAQRIVADMESRADTSDLWTKTWQATSWTLKKAFDSGIISRDNYDYVSKMFGYYIPLRGWDETTAGDIFDYVGSGAKDTAFSPTLHKAGGRKSQADNPLAYISQMAVSAIVQGNKNKVKQAFFNFVENHPTNLVSVSEMWYRNYGTVTAPDWREDVPYIPENATADEIADIIKKHDEDMEKLKQQGLATKQRGRLHLNVPVKKGQALEHHVEVMLNGKKYIMYINGNPRAAQALNGTRAHRASENSFESSRVANFGRKLAERYTSLSPAFTLSNALRDLTMAAITTLIKEDPKYAIRFRLNVAKLVGPARMFSLMRWYKKLGQSGLNGQNWLSDTQKYFYEFMTQGAETGFTSLKDIEDYKKDMAKEFGNMNQSVINPKRLFRGLKNGLEFANRCIEDMTRFAIYMASRQSGRSIAQSVKDAKNITLNFNRKGSGEMGNSTYRNLQIFINPAIQALQNIVKMAMDHPFKFGGVTGLVALVGVAQPLITQLLAGIFGGGDGDDDDWSPAEEYWKLPTWQRRNNFVFWIPGTKKFGMIPLAQEFRVFHGFGETLSTVLGNHSSENPGLEVLTQAADLLPLDFTGNNGNPLVNVAPTIVQPLLQIGFNTDFTGRPLYKDNDFNKYEPSFQKAYVGTPSWLIKSSQLINEVTGGNDHKQGAWERTKVGQYANNPAVIDHLLKGYYGGLYSFFAQLGGSIMKAASGKTPDVQEVPIVNRVITTPRESQQNGKQQLPDWYFDMVDEAKRTQNELSGYKRDTRDKKEGALNHIEDMTKSEDFKKEMQINALINIVNQIRAAQPSVAEPKNKEEAETKQELDNGLKTVLGKLNTIRTTGKPLTDDDMNDQ